MGVSRQVCFIRVIMNRRNILAAAVLLVVTSGYGYLTSQLPARTLPNTPDPSFFPWINTVLLGVLSAALLAQGVLRRSADGTKDEGGAVSRNMGMALGCFLVYLLVLPYLGFILASVPFFASFMLLYGERRKFHIIAGAVGVPLFLYALFRYGFTVLLPRGLLGGYI